MIINLNDGIIKVESEEEREALLDALRPKGEWINQEQGAFYPIECSNCHNEPFCDDEGYVLSDFCPKCGADMREEQDHEKQS